MVAHLHGMEGVESSNLFRSTHSISLSVKWWARLNPFTPNLHFLSILPVMVKKLFSLKISLLIKYKHFFIVCISLLIGSLIYNFYSRTFPVFPNRVVPVIPYNFHSDFVKRPNIVLILLDDLDTLSTP